MAKKKTALTTAGQRGATKKNPLRISHTSDVHLGLKFTRSREPDFGVTSVNCNLSELLAKRESPR